MRHLTLILAATGCLAAFGVAGCGSSSSSSGAGSSSSSAAGATTASSSSSGTKHFAKTKFVLHAGLAFGAFKHFIYNPVKAGDLKHPFSHKFTLVKAGLASLFVYHELKLAAEDVRSSKILSALFSPLTAAADKIKSLKSSLTSGGASSADIEGLNSQLSQIGSTASSKGQSITEAIPSVTQLASHG
ncbi:MAG: hypothetical protein ACR2IP_03765 [Solirubrobacteraceae bacterium]